MAFMNIWLLKDGENLPVQPGQRPMRAGLLSKELVRRGHDVTWWTSTFSHQRKTLLYGEDTSIEVEPGLTLRMLFAGTYARNVSLRRYWHHEKLAKTFARNAREARPPDVIVASFPQIGLAYEAVRYARRYGVACIVDVRDPWPETFLSVFPKGFRTVARLLFCNDFRRSRVVFERATSIVGSSKGFVEWALALTGRRQGPRDRVFYLGYPERTKSETTGSDRIRWLAERIQNRTIFTFVGSFGRSYQLQLVCDAAEVLERSRENDIHFVLAGDGEQFHAVERRAAHVANITLTGWLAGEQIQGLLESSDVGLIPCNSLRDTMPNKIFEYLSFGLPVISSLLGEMEEMIRENDIGFSYAPGDRDALVGAVRALAREPGLRVRQSRNARAFFQRDFGASKTSASYADHVESVIRKRSAVR